MLWTPTSWACAATASINARPTPRPSWCGSTASSPTYNSGTPDQCGRSSPAAKPSTASSSSATNTKRPGSAARASASTTQPVTADNTSSCGRQVPTPPVRRGAKASTAERSASSNRRTRMRPVCRLLARSGELAAGAVDLLASGVADGGGDAGGLEATDELALVGRVGGGPLRARCRVQRDQVDVHPAPVAARIELLREQVGPPGVVVDVADHRVLDRDAPLGLPRVPPGRIEDLVDLP